MSLHYILWTLKATKEARCLIVETIWPSHHRVTPITILYISEVASDTNLHHHHASHAGAQIWILSKHLAWKDKTLRTGECSLHSHNSIGFICPFLSVQYWMDLLKYYVLWWITRTHHNASIRFFFSDPKVEFY